MTKVLLPALTAAAAVAATPPAPRDVTKIGYGQQLQNNDQTNHWVVWVDGVTACPNLRLLGPLTSSPCGQVFSLAGTSATFKLGDVRLFPPSPTYLPTYLLNHPLSALPQTPPPPLVNLSAYLGVSSTDLTSVTSVDSLAATVRRQQRAALGVLQRRPEVERLPQAQLQDPLPRVAARHRPARRLRLDDATEPSGELRRRGIGGLGKKGHCCI